MRKSWQSPIFVLEIEKYFDIEKKGEAGEEINVYSGRSVSDNRN